MSKLVWDKAEKRIYETGVDRGVFYSYGSGQNGAGVVWNGLISVNESHSGGEPVSFYAGNKKYLNLISYEEMTFTIEAYGCPPGFTRCLGAPNLMPGISIGGQNKKHFGFCYRSLIGNQNSGNDYHYKIHMIFDCLASPSEKGHSTQSDSTDPLTYSWDVQANPVIITNGDSVRTACVVLDSRKFEEAGLLRQFKGFEQLLYGTEEHDAYLPRVFRTDGKWLWNPFNFLEDTIFTAESA